MDVLETAGIKKFPLPHVEDLGFLFTLNEFQAGTRTVMYLSPLSNCTVPSALVILPFHI